MKLAFAYVALCAVSGSAAVGAMPTARADLQAQWQVAAPLGPWSASKIENMLVDPAGAVCVVGAVNTGSNIDVAVAVYEPDGSLRWRRTYDGPLHTTDLALCAALTPGGELLVGGQSAGLTPGSSDSLLLRFDSREGALLGVSSPGSGSPWSRSVAFLAVEPQGALTVGLSVRAHANADLEVEVVKYGATGSLEWAAPLDPNYEFDQFFDLRLSPSGEPVALFKSLVANGSAYDSVYFVYKLDPASGSLLWTSSWVNSGVLDVAAMVIDPQGDVFVTGDQGYARYGTFKLRGSDGHVLWEVHDAPATAGPGDWARPRAIEVDGAGGVYITGTAGELEGDFDIYTVKRDTLTGALLWTSRFGGSCDGCWDNPRSMRVDPQGHLFITGESTTPPGDGDELMLVLDASSGSWVDSSVIASPGQYAWSWLLRFDADFNVYQGSMRSEPFTPHLAKYAARYARPTSYCTAGPTSHGCRPEISAVGAPSASAAAGFTLRVEGLEGQRQGILFYGLSGRVAQPWGGAATSYLCVKPPLQRMEVQNSGGVLGACDGALVQDWLAYLAAHPAALGAPVSAGTTVDVQAWYRDSASAIPTRLSNALEFVVEF